MFLPDLTVWLYAPAPHETGKPQALSYEENAGQEELAINFRAELYRQFD
jgi:hypothetical protein